MTDNSEEESSKRKSTDMLSVQEKKNKNKARRSSKGYKIVESQFEDPVQAQIDGFLEPEDEEEDENDLSQVDVSLPKDEEASLPGSDFAHTKTPALSHHPAIEQSAVGVFMDPAKKATVTPALNHHPTIEQSAVGVFLDMNRKKSDDAPANTGLANNLNRQKSDDTPVKSVLSNHPNF